MDATEIHTWLVGRMAETLNVPPQSIDVTAPLDELGLDSKAVMGLSGDIEQYFNISIEPTVLWDYSSVGELVAHLAKLCNKSGSGEG